MSSGDCIKKPYRSQAPRHGIPKRLDRQSNLFVYWCLDLLIIFPTHFSLHVLCTIISYSARPLEIHQCFSHAGTAQQ